MPMSTIAAAQQFEAAPPGRRPCHLCATRQNCLIGRLPDPDRVRISPHIRQIVFQKNDALLKEGVVSDVIRIIKLGTAMASRHGPDGLEHPIALVGRGGLMGKFGLFGQANQLGAVAVSAGRMCEVRIDELQQARLMDPAFMHSLNTSMVRAFGRLADWSQVVRLRGLQRQLMATLLLLGQEQGNAVVRLPGQAALATLLTTTRESIARTLNQLNELGMLHRVDRWHCELKDQDLRRFNAIGENG